LYSFKGKPTQPKKCRAPIMHTKMDFSRQNWEQKKQSFCHVHNVMIQKKLHIPGEMERASLETDESWRKVSW
jgi:hypothetical protein